MVLVALALAGLTGASCTSTKEKDTRKIVLGCYDLGQFNGQVLIARNDSILYDMALDYSDFRTHKPFLKSTACYLASLARPVIALSIMLLPEQGLLSYDDTGKRITFASSITISSPQG